LGCGCSKQRRAAAAVLGYYVILPDGSEIPPVSAGAAPFLSPIEARVEVRRAGGGTIRTVKR